MMDLLKTFNRIKGRFRIEYEGSAYKDASAIAGRLADGTEFILITPYPSDVEKVWGATKASKSALDLSKMVSVAVLPSRALIHDAEDLI